MVFAIPVIDFGGRVSGIGPEQVVTDFAVLNGNNLTTDLPQDLTICSSLASGPPVSHSVALPGWETMGFNLLLSSATKGHKALPDVFLRKFY